MKSMKPPGRIIRVRITSMQEGIQKLLAGKDTREGLAAVFDLSLTTLSNILNCKSKTLRLNSNTVEPICVVLSIDVAKITIKSRSKKKTSKLVFPIEHPSDRFIMEVHLRKDKARS